MSKAQSLAAWWLAFIACATIGVGGMWACIESGKWLALAHLGILAINLWLARVYWRKMGEIR